MYYLFINDDNKIIGKGQCPFLDCKNIEVSKQIYDDFLDEKYIYKDEEIILNPNWENILIQKNREKINNLSLTKREIFLALYKDKKITPEQIKSMITDNQILIEFDYAEKYYRGNPLINQIGNMLGYSEEELDNLFINKDIIRD